MLLREPAINRSARMGIGMIGVRPKLGNFLVTIAPAVALAFASLGALVVVQAAPQSPREIAAVFPPWWSQVDTLAAARQAGAVSAIGGWRNVVVVVSDDDGLARRLNSAGALLQLDPILSGLCNTPTDAAHV
jgi:hypothetical protein